MSIFRRFADALQMKVKCLVRANGNYHGALNILNEIFTKRYIPIIYNVNVEDTILEKNFIEKGLELYWEGHRRQDMIRFGTFLLPKSGKLILLLKMQYFCLYRRKQLTILPEEY